MEDYLSSENGQFGPFSPDSLIIDRVNIENRCKRNEHFERAKETSTTTNVKEHNT